MLFIHTLLCYLYIFTYVLYIYIYIYILRRDDRKNLNNLIINICGYLIINDEK